MTPVVKRLWQPGVTALGLFYTAVMGYIVLRPLLRLPFIVVMLPLATLAFFAFSLGHALWTMGGRRALLFLGLTFGISLLFESVGVLTGWPYGPYHYTDRLGAKLFGLVPPLIPIAWFMMAYPSQVLVERLTGGGGQEGIGQAIWRAGLSAMAITGWDLMMDPLMVASGHWVWEVKGGYFGIPAQNYAGWLITTFTFFLLYRLLTRHQPARPWGPSSARFQALPIGAYVITWLANVLIALEAGRTGVAVAGFFGMGSFALLGLGRLTTADQGRHRGPRTED